MGVVGCVSRRGTSVGSPYTAHADFWNAWNQARLEQLTADCLNRNVDCGTVVG